jgi:hypothetical protein
MLTRIEVEVSREMAKSDSPVIIENRMQPKLETSAAHVN